MADFVYRNADFKSKICNFDFFSGFLLDMLPFLELELH